jgi:hypothetical protein
MINAAQGEPKKPSDADSWGTSCLSAPFRKLCQNHPRQARHKTCPEAKTFFFCHPLGRYILLSG